MDELISHAVREAVTEATQEFVALAQGDIKMDMLDGQLRDLHAEVIMNRVQGQETTDIFSQCTSDIRNELADIKEELVKVNEGTEIQLSQNVPLGVSIIGLHGEVFNFPYCLK